MILVNQVKIKVGFKNNDLRKKLSSLLKVLPDDISNIQIIRRSLDARKKPDIFYVLTVACDVKHEDSVLRKSTSNQVSKYDDKGYSFCISGELELNSRPLIVGAGPAGLFAAYELAMHGYKPIVLERGFDVDSRSTHVEEFWNGGELKKNSNVLFGEGGAGTFSDGKLNTLVKDKFGRNREVLEVFVKYGADKEILYDSKPHVGTDVLKRIVKAMREDIIAHGGEFRFNAQVTDINIENGKVKSVIVNGLINIPCDVLILAIGHSARDTFEMIYNKGIHMEQKDFAVGFRVEHKQKLIDDTLLSDDPQIMRHLPHASYKLVYNAENGRSVYSFCMCPGGFVVNASSEDKRLCVNGMSYSGRDGENANSAIVVTVNTKDYANDSPLAGVEFQRKLEENAYKAGNGAIPVQFYKDFKADVFDSVSLNEVDFDNFMKITPQTKGAYTIGKVSSILPKELSKTIIEGIEHFNKIIPGFSDDYVVLSGVESRTSSPVRITRNDSFESLSVNGLFPAGEGAGYAGGITSAAMDGIKIAEQIAKIYKPLC